MCSGPRLAATRSRKREHRQTLPADRQFQAPCHLAVLLKSTLSAVALRNTQLRVCQCRHLGFIKQVHVSVTKVWVSCCCALQARGSTPSTCGASPRTRTSAASSSGRTSWSEGAAAVQRPCTHGPADATLAAKQRQLLMLMPLGRSSCSASSSSGMASRHGQVLQWGPWPGQRSAKHMYSMSLCGVVREATLRAHPPWAPGCSRVCGSHGCVCEPHMVGPWHCRWSYQQACEQVLFYVGLICANSGRRPRCVCCRQCCRLFEAQSTGACGVQVRFASVIQGVQSAAPMFLFPRLRDFARVQK